MLNSAEHEIFSVNKYENANNTWHFHIDQKSCSCSTMFSKKEFVVNNNLRFIRRTNFMVCQVEHVKSYITLDQVRLCSD